MKKIKKRGSSLIVVVIIMGILFTTGTAILSLTTTDYKMRINESNRLKNLYKSDSGLDVAYNVIVKNSEAAIDYADNKIKDEYIDIEVDDDTYININNSFKEYFIQFLGKVAADNGNSSTDAILAQGIVHNKYKVKNIENGIVTYNWKEDIQSEAKIEIKDYLYEDNKITINVESTFMDTSGEFKNTKKLSTKFEVNAPDYQQTIVSESVNVEIGIYPVFNSKAIATDGNVIVNGDLDVTGDIWVEGDATNLENNPSFTFDKYKGGIAIKDSMFNITGNIYTANNVHLKDNSIAIITGDVYALNAYVGKDTTQNTSTQNTLKINSNLIVNNDLALNATESNIVIRKNFYGISDKTTSFASTDEKAMKSSSIIVNDTSNTSSITVSEKSFISGVAYINATDDEGNKYQTGESVAVKGNYIAYTNVLDTYEDKVTLKFYNPLQLVDKINGLDSVEEKAKYIEQYYIANSSELRKNGINLVGDVNSVGAYIKGGNMKYDGWSGDSVVGPIREEYARNVYSMGNLSSGTLSDIYNKGVVVKNVSNQIDFDEIIEGNSYNEKHGKVIITKSDLTIENGKLNNSEINSGLIITDGNININGNFDFQGTIIAKGNISFDNKGTKKITYNDDLVKKVIAINYDNKLDKLFLDSYINTATINVGEEVKFENTSNGYKLNEIVTSKLWKIEK